MKPTLVCVFLLACAPVCFTAPALLSCRCPALNKNVRFNLIDDVVELDPRPYCSRKEVIVKLKDGSSRCLDPKEKFTQAVVLTKRLQVLRNNMKKNASLRSTVAPAPVTSGSPPAPVQSSSPPAPVQSSSPPAPVQSSTPKSR